MNLPAGEKHTNKTPHQVQLSPMYGVVVQVQSWAWSGIGTRSRGTRMIGGTWRRNARTQAGITRRSKGEHNGAKAPASNDYARTPGRTLFPHWPTPPIGRWRRRQLHSSRAIRLPFVPTTAAIAPDWIMDDDPPICPKWTWIRLPRDARVFPCGFFPSLFGDREPRWTRKSARATVRARLRRHTVVSETFSPGGNRFLL